jgi:enoyl-CoA hydratase/carnithine racemase
MIELIFMRELETVLFEVDENHVATITLNRPEVLNSFNEPMLEDFEAIWKRCRRDDDIHAIVLQANGDRAFSTGVDRKSGRFRHPNPWSEDDPGLFLGPKQNRVWKPIICAVHGMAAGGAFYWLNEVDVMICSEEATFFDPHTTFGMTSALEPIGMLRRIPLGEVLRIALFGNDERVSATRALQIGLVTEVVPAADLRARAYTLALRLASKPPLAIQGTVKAIWDSLEMTPHGGREIPLIYPQLANPRSATEFIPGKGGEYEIR